MKDDKFEMRSEWEWNPDVPAETRLKHAVKETKMLHRKIGELESEILYLKDIISHRDQAISDFKIWQGNVAKLKIEEWCALAKSRMALSPDLIAQYNLIRSVLRNKSLFESLVRRLDILYKNYIKFQKTLSNEDNIRDSR